MNRRVAITGLGMANSLGPDVATVWTRLIAGENGIRPITFFDPAQYRCTLAAQIPNEEYGWSEAGRDGYSFAPPLPSMDVRDSRRGVRLFIQCVSEAVKSSGIADSGLKASEVGVAAAGSVAHLDHEVATDFYANRMPDGKDVDVGKFMGSSRMPSNSFAVRCGDLMAAI